MRDIVALVGCVFCTLCCVGVLCYFVAVAIKDIRKDRHDEGTIVLLLLSSLMIIIAVWLIVTCIISIA